MAEGYPNEETIPRKNKLRSGKETSAWQARDLLSENNNHLRVALAEAQEKTLSNVN